MTHATRADKGALLDLLVNIFADDPRVQWLADPTSRHYLRRVRALMNLMLEEGLARQTVYATADRKAVAIWKTDVRPRTSLPLMRASLAFALRMGVPRLRRSSRLEREVNARRPTDGRYDYLWLIGVHPDHRGQGLSSLLLHPHLQEADRRRQPVYLETTHPAHVQRFARYGFVVFGEYPLDPLEGTTLYFLRRPPRAAATSVASSLW